MLPSRWADACTLRVWGADRGLSVAVPATVWMEQWGGKLSSQELGTSKSNPRVPSGKKFTPTLRQAGPRSCVQLKWRGRAKRAWGI